MGTRAAGQRLTIAQALRYQNRGGDPLWSPRLSDLDIEIILSHALRRPRAWLLAHGGQALTPAQAKSFQTLLRQRAHGIPLAYLIGEREFYGHAFQVTPDVLIPRPESELLIDLAVGWMGRRPALPRRGRSVGAENLLPLRRVVDIGTGSGCLITSLALETARRGWAGTVRLYASDISSAALTIAKRNARRLGAKGITWRQRSLWEPWKNQRFDLVIANLPYLEPIWYVKSLRHEPKKALVGGKDGLALYRRLLTNAAAHLRHGGTMLLEIDPRQRNTMQTLVNRLLPNAELTFHRDLAGRWRVVEIETR